MTRVERRRAAAQIQRMLELVDDDQMAADGPVGIAVVRRLEGAMLALTAIDTTTTPLVQTERNVRSRAPDTS